MNASRTIALALLAVAVAAAPFLACGCWDLVEIEEYLEPTLLALDRGTEPGSVRVTIMVQEPLGGPGAGGIGGGSSGGGGAVSTQVPKGVVTVTAEAPTFYVASGRLNQVTNRIITYSHLELILIGEDLARLGITPFLDAFIRSRDFPWSVPMAVVDGATGEQALQSVRSDVETSPARYMSDTLMTAHGDYGLSLFIRLHDVVIANDEPGKHIVMPLFRLVEKPPLPAAPGQSSGGGGGGSGQQAPTEKRAQTGGVACFREDRLVAKLDPERTLGLLLARGALSRAFVGIAGAVTGNTPTVLQIAHEDHRVKVERQGRLVNIELDVKVRATIMEVAGPTQALTSKTLPELGKLLASELERRMTEALNFAKTEVGGDIFDLSVPARRTFGTWPEWANYDWHQAFRSANFTVKVEVSAIRTGFLLQPLTPSP